MATIRVGIIGCGKIFPMHAVSVSKQPGVQIVAVCDNKPERAAKAAQDYGCKAYGDYREMIDKEKPDVVHICTPHYLHAEMTIYALEHGADVLTEKPMALTVEDAERMQKAAHDNNRRLMVSFQNRFNPGSMLIKDALESGKLGAVRSVRAMVTWDRSDEYYSLSDWKGTWDKEGGGVVIDQAIHTLDLANWFVNSKIKSVDAHIANRAHNIIKVEDCAEGVIAYENGVHTSFFAINYYTYNAPVEIELHCENGIAKLVGEKATINYNDEHCETADRDPNETFDFGNVKQYWGVSHMHEITHFYDTYKSGEPMRNSVDDVLQTHRMIFAIYQSGKEQRICHPDR